MNPESPTVISAVINERLTMAAFQALSGILAGTRFIKLVVDRSNNEIHFLSDALFKFHSDYIGETFLGKSREAIDEQIDEFNRSVYVIRDRRFFLGTLALHHSSTDGSFFTLETTESDQMESDMILAFFNRVALNIDPSYPLLFKPASHYQESELQKIPLEQIPRVYSHQIFSSSRYVPLNFGFSQGRIRAFQTDESYQLNRNSIEWYDIIVMNRVPDDIPRVSGLINAKQTTPLSHTNVLASGWQIPNCIDLEIFKKILANEWDGQWVDYTVAPGATEPQIKKIDRPSHIETAPVWSVQKITLEEPETHNIPILSLQSLRIRDRSRYGTKAANIGEIYHVLNHGSEKLIGFYRIKRPPRANLLPYLAQNLGVSESANLSDAAHRFLKKTVHLPQGIAIPFSYQQAFLESSPKIQQQIGKLKMALEMGAKQVDSICMNLQQMIQTTKMPDWITDEIDQAIASQLGGVSQFVVRSSSNAEDLHNFSAAGIYESINHVSSAEKIFDSIKKVWASLISPRSVRLRQEVGISLDASYMGVIVQEQIPGTTGGVMVTTNPMKRNDFRSVYLNLSPHSVNHIVQGTELPIQMIYNTVEGGGTTLSLGSATEKPNAELERSLQNLALAGRLLQSHFSPDYTFSQPIDVEWIASESGDLTLLQVRPFAR